MTYDTKNQIRDLRKAAGLTQGDLAEKIGSNPVSVSQYERGDRQLTERLICKIAEILGTTPNVVLGYEAAPKADPTLFIDAGAAFIEVLEKKRIKLPPQKLMRYIAEIEAICRDPEFAGDLDRIKDAVSVMVRMAHTETRP